MQQAALAHILNAEGEKLQRVLAYETIAAETILQTNKSVESICLLYTSEPSAEPGLPVVKKS